jgi:hypothetical protein
VGEAPIITAADKDARVQNWNEFPPLPLPFVYLRFTQMCLCEVPPASSASSASSGGPAF